MSGERFQIAGLEQQAGIADGPWESGCGRGYDRLATGHRLHHGDAEPFVEAARDIDIAGIVIEGKFGVAPGPCKDHIVLQAQFNDELAGSVYDLLIRERSVVADEQQTYVRVVLLDQRHHPNQDIDALIASHPSNV